MMDMTLTRIISGGQNGADQGGLVAGRALGIETGGTAPQGWWTSDGPQKARLLRLGLIEGPDDPKTYVKRTISNVRDADGTVWFGKTDSPGARLTLGECERQEKPLLVNPHSGDLSRWARDHSIHTLNVAGNREYTNPGIFGTTAHTIWEAFA